MKKYTRKEIKYGKFIVLIVVFILICVAYNLLFVKIGDERVYRFTDEFSTDLNSTDADLKNAKKLKKLKCVSVNSNNVTNLDFIYNYSKIQMLDIEVTENMDISSISKCNNLEELYLFGAELDNINLISGNSKLKVLNLGFSRVSDISGISQIKSLETVLINDMTSEGVTGLDELKQLPNLQKLSLYNANASDINFIKEIENLNFLSLIDSRHTVDLKQFSNLNHLDTLCVTGSNIDNPDSLLEFENIKNVFFSKETISDETANKIKRNGINVEFR